jgi:predicted anti-sigma-YlaC factor YlaD
MRTCKSPQYDELETYVLGTCSPQEHNKIEEHLAECLSCSQYVTSLQPVREQLLSTSFSAEPGSDLKNIVMAKVKSEAELFQAASSSTRKETSKQRFSWPKITVLRLCRTSCRRYSFE